MNASQCRPHSDAHTLQSVYIGADVKPGPGRLDNAAPAIYFLQAIFFATVNNTAERRRELKYLLIYISQDETLAVEALHAREVEARVSELQLAPADYAVAAGEIFKRPSDPKHWQLKGSDYLSG